MEKLVTEYWVRHDASDISGPFTAGQIKEMAAAGAITESALISKDRRQWYKAGGIKGLLLPAANDSARTPKQETSPNHANSTPHEASPAVERTTESAATSRDSNDSIWKIIKQQSENTALFLLATSYLTAVASVAFRTWTSEEKVIDAMITLAFFSIFAALLKLEYRYHWFWAWIILLIGLGGNVVYQGFEFLNRSTDYDGKDLQRFGISLQMLSMFFSCVVLAGTLVATIKNRFAWARGHEANQQADVEAFGPSISGWFVLGILLLAISAFLASHWIDNDGPYKSAKVVDKEFMGVALLLRPGIMDVRGLTPAALEEIIRTTPMDDGTCLKVLGWMETEEGYLLNVQGRQQYSIEILWSGGATALMNPIPFDSQYYPALLYVTSLIEQRNEERCVATSK